MLTKIDFQSITKIVKSENNSLKKEVTNLLKTEVTNLKTEMTKRFNKLDRKLDYTINFLDRDYLKLLERVEKIEEHLGINPTTS